MTDVEPGNKVRIDREYAKSMKSFSLFVGSFGWTIARGLFEDSELEGKNFYGTHGKLPFSPRRKEAIEDAVRDLYGPDDTQMKAAAGAINSGLRGVKHRASLKVAKSNQVSCWTAGVNLGSIMQMAKVPAPIIPNCSV